MTSLVPSSSSNSNNEEDQLNRINLQALQNRDPYIRKILDQAQRVCVYKFLADKRQWVFYLSERHQKIDGGLENLEFVFILSRNDKNSKEHFSCMKGNCVRFKKKSYLALTKHHHSFMKIV